MLKINRNWGNKCKIQNYKVRQNALKHRKSKNTREKHTKRKRKSLEGFIHHTLYFLEIFYLANNKYIHIYITTYIQLKFKLNKKYNISGNYKITRVIIDGD